MMSGKKSLRESSSPAVSLTPPDKWFAAQRASRRRKARDDDDHHLLVWFCSSARKMIMAGDGDEDHFAPKTLKPPHLMHLSVTDRDIIG